jgi:hypothetical protein
MREYINLQFLPGAVKLFRTPASFVETKYGQSD